MFKCNDCGAVFEEPASYEEHVGDFWGSPAYEKFYECPNCGSDAFEEYEEGEEE